MILGRGAACGACWKKVSWKWKGASAMELLTLVMWVMIMLILYLAVQKCSIQTRAIISIDLVVPVFQKSTTAWLSQWKRELLWVSRGVSRYWLLQWYQKFFHIIAISFSSSGDQWDCIHLPHQYTFYLTVTKLTASTYSDMKVEVFLRYRRCHFRMEGRSAIVLCQHELVCLMWCDDVA